MSGPRPRVLRRCAAWAVAAPAAAVRSPELGAGPQVRQLPSALEHSRSRPRCAVPERSHAPTFGSRQAVPGTAGPPSSGDVTSGAAGAGPARAAAPSSPGWLPRRSRPATSPSRTAGAFPPFEGRRAAAGLPRPGKGPGPPPGGLLSRGLNWRWLRGRWGGRMNGVSRGRRRTMGESGGTEHRTVRNRGRGRNGGVDWGPRLERGVDGGPEAGGGRGRGDPTSGRGPGWSSLGAEDGKVGAPGVRGN